VQGSKQMQQSSICTGADMSFSFACEGYPKAVGLAGRGV